MHEDIFLRSGARYLKQEIAQLRLEKTKLENTMNYFQNNYETYLKIKQTVKHEIEYILANPSRLLRFALASIFESARRHPGKFQTTYYSMSTSEIQSLLDTSIGQNEHNSNQYRDNDDAPEKILLDESEQIYSKLIDNIASKCINEMVNYIESNVQYDMPQEVYHKSHTTCGVEISVSEVLSNFAAQICQGSKNQAGTNE